MLKNDCIFCKIIKAEVPAKIIAQNDYVIVIEDIHPKAPIHYLIIPKVHIENIKNMNDTHEKYILESIKMAKHVSKDILNGKDFNLVLNDGPNSGQVVFHMHWHFLSGRNLGKEAGI